MQDIQMQGRAYDTTVSVCYQSEASCCPQLSALAAATKQARVGTSCGVHTHNTQAVWLHLSLSDNKDSSTPVQRMPAHQQVREKHCSVNPHITCVPSHPG
jgi:hypothetical protein